MMALGHLDAARAAPSGRRRPLLSPRPRRGTLIVTTSDVSLDILMDGAVRDLAAVSALQPVAIAAADTGRLARVAEREGVQGHVVPMPRDPSPLQDAVALVALTVLLLRLRPAMVVYGTPKAALLTSVAAAITRVPVRVQILHGLRLETVRGLGRRVMVLVECLVARLSTATVAVSASLRERCSDLGIPVDRMRVLGPGAFVGVDLERRARLGNDAEVRGRRRAELGIPLPTLLVGFVGRLHRDKGIVELLDAIALLRQDGAATELVLVGPDEGVDALPVRTRALMAAEWVHRTGAVADPSEYVAAIDALCLPSHREGLGTVLLEAMATGVPVVATRATGIVDVVVHEQTGLLADVGDAAGIAEQLRRVLGDATLRARLAQAASAMVARDFTQEAVRRRHRVFYVAAQRWAKGLAESPAVV
jgi:glycosyltransferase involved in cell wall biosynthesis